MYPRFQRNNRCDTLESKYENVEKKLKVMMKKTTETTFWQTPSKHREELAGFPFRGTL